MIDFDYDDIARVARELDEDALKVGIAPILARLGISERGAMDAAKQRALRMYMLDNGMPIPVQRGPVPVPESELVSGASLWLDGFLIGMRALALHVIQSATPPDDQHRRSG